MSQNTGFEEIISFPVIEQPDFECVYADRDFPELLTTEELVLELEKSVFLKPQAI